VWRFRNTTTPLLQELSRQSSRNGAPLKLQNASSYCWVQPNQEGVRGFKALSAIRTVDEDLESLDDQIARGFRHGAIPDEARRPLARLNLLRYNRVINASHAALGCWLAGEIPTRAKAA
jgi:hypothetical protein